MNLDKIRNIVVVKRIMQYFFLLITGFVLFQSQSANAEIMTFPSNLSTWTENGHSWMWGSTGSFISTKYRSAPYCLFQSNNWGAYWEVAKSSGNKFQLNSLWIKSTDISFTVQFLGKDGSEQKYSKDVTVTTTYTQITFTGWTNIDRIQGVTPGVNTNWACDDWDYTVVNTAPTNMSLSNSYIDDGDPTGTVVGAFTTTDIDDNGTHTYTFASGGTDNASFTIDGNELKTGFVADYDTKSSYSIKIRTTDEGGLYYESSITISVNYGYPPRFYVTQAEDESFNGVYERNGDYVWGGPQYTKESTNYHLVNFNCTSHWALVNGDPASDCPGYTSLEAVLEPPANGWRQGGEGTKIPAGFTGLSSNVHISETDESLPIELAYFNASRQNQAIVISWKTASETNHLGFILERAEKNDEGQQLAWQQIASYVSQPALKGQGNTATGRNYTITDQAVNSKSGYLYRLASVDINGNIEYSHQIEVQAGTAIPEAFALYPAFPNPFNPSTTIRYDVAEMCNVTLIITDINGKTVRTLLDKITPAGNHDVTWNGSDDQGMRVASGMYFYTIKAGDRFVARQKMLLLK